jgi:serine/threonine protein kinase
MEAAQNLSTELLTIIDDDTVAYHRDSEPIICHLTKLNDLNIDVLSIRSMIPNHPHLELYYGGVISERWMITEVLSNKTLKDVIQNIDLDSKTIWNIIIQVAKGLQHLHSNNIVHQNINLDNISFRYRSTGYEAVIINFNQAVKIFDDATIFPSSLNPQNISKGLDMHDFGVLIQEAFHKGNDLPVAIKDIVNDCLVAKSCFDDEFLDRLNKVSFDETTTNSNWSYCIIA